MFDSKKPDILRQNGITSRVVKNLLFSARKLSFGHPPKPIAHTNPHKKIISSPLFVNSNRYNSQNAINKFNTQKDLPYF